MSHWTHRHVQCANSHSPRGHVLSSGKPCPIRSVSCPCLPSTADLLWWHRLRIFHRREPHWLPDSPCYCLHRHTDILRHTEAYINIQWQTWRHTAGLESNFTTCACKNYKHKCTHIQRQRHTDREREWHAVIFTVNQNMTSQLLWTRNIDSKNKRTVHTAQRQSDFIKPSNSSPSLYSLWWSCGKEPDLWPWGR